MEIVVYNHQTISQPASAELDQLEALLKSESAMVWVDMYGPTPADVAVMEKIFQFHPLAIEDTQNQYQRPKVDEYPAYLFSIVNTMRLHEQEVRLQELNIFAGANYVVTVHNQPEPALDTARRRIHDLSGAMPLSVGYALYILIDVVVDAYFPVLDQLSDKIDTMSESILYRPRQEMLAKLYEYKRTLGDIWRVIGHQRDVFSVLTREKSRFIDDTVLLFHMRDVYDHLLRAGDLSHVLRETLNNLVELYVSSVSNRLNQQVNRLTIVTMGIGLLTVISGFYGMNFSLTWPPFESPLGVPFVLLLMLLTVLAVVWFVRRMKQF